MLHATRIGQKFLVYKTDKFGGENHHIILGEVDDFKEAIAILNEQLHKDEKGYIKDFYEARC